MDILILVIVLILLAETSVLFVKSLKNSSAKKSGRRKVFVDTSALIDGRILDVAKTGFIGDDLLIPRSVIHELQLLADGKDGDKRALARRGLDNVNELERVVYCNTEIYPDESDRTPVDDKLIKLAKQNHGLIMTNDFNLMKVAAAEHIDVLNVNNLATAIAGDLSIGDIITVKITEKGDKRSQGIGHLENGTMVVVDHAAGSVGKEVEAEIIRFYQTVSGLIVFAAVKGSLPKNHTKNLAAKSSAAKSKRR
ncbi:TRAM domain-containing protein [Candidatus Saccharibacteria bacterium]|nr:TRAM domain-containing protein [Candidatus Saccharibacteria bacterium]